MWVLAFRSTLYLKMSFSFGYSVGSVVQWQQCFFFVSLLTACWVYRVLLWTLWVLHVRCNTQSKGSNCLTWEIFFRLSKRKSTVKYAWEEIAFWKFHRNKKTSILLVGIFFLVFSSLVLTGQAGWQNLLSLVWITAVIPSSAALSSNHCNAQTSPKLSCLKRTLEKKSSQRIFNLEWQLNENLIFMLLYLFLWANILTQTYCTPGHKSSLWYI